MPHPLSNERPKSAGCSWRCWTSTRASGQAGLAGAQAGVSLPDAAERIAELDGVQVLLVALPASNTDRVRKADVDTAAKLLADQLGDDLLLVFANPSATQLHIILP